MVLPNTRLLTSARQSQTQCFLRTIQESLAKLPPGTPTQRLLKRTATTMIGMREVSAQEAVYILSSTLCLYQKSRTVIKVKVSRHDRRYYRVEPRTIANASLDSEDAEHVRLEQIETAYMQRPSTADFESLCFREFCERYEISYTSPSERQRLKRWELLGNAGFIKARTAPQLMRPSPKYTHDESNADYCYAQLFLYKPWRQLAEIAVDDEDILREYRSWKDDQESQYISQIVAAKARVEVLEALREERLDNEPLPAPQWSTSLPADTYPLVSTHVAKLTFPSRYQYTADEIDRASSFVRLVIRPFVKERKREDQKPLARLPYMYPTEQQVPAMTADQWVPFALCMRQNRLRAKAEATQTVCTPIQMIVSGEGGTGKSWLVRQVIEDTKVVFGSDQSRKRILLMAHQGSAAYLIGGGTITSCLGLPGRGSYLQKYEALSGTDKGLTTLRRLQNEYEHVHLVVIDEFGVISCGMLHWIDQRLREIFPQTQDQPFGGRDVIFTGDFGQLGPVNPSALSTPDTLLMSEVERAGRTLWTSIQLYCTLNQQNRGIQDPNWYAMLGRVRRGTASPEDVTLINSRMQPSPTPTQTTTHLAYRNVDVDLANKSALRRMDGPICIIDADQSMHFPGRITDEKMSENECKQLINEAKEIKTSNAEFLPLQLSLAIGAPIVLTKNIQQQIGLCNGSRGTVYDIICAPQLKHNQPIVLVRMDNYNGPSFLPEVRSIIPITCETVRLTPKDAPYHLSRTALPLRLAFATTIHKIQGQTCEQVILNPSHINNPALAYVALSRVRRRSDFFLTSPITQQQLQKTDTAKLLSDKEDNRLSELSECTRLESTAIVAAMQLLANEHNASLIEG